MRHRSAARRREHRRGRRVTRESAPDRSYAARRARPRRAADGRARWAPGQVWDPAARRRVGAAVASRPPDRLVRRHPGGDRSGHRRSAGRRAGRRPAGARPGRQGRWRSGARMGLSAHRCRAGQQWEAGVAARRREVRCRARAVPHGGSVGPAREFPRRRSGSGRRVAARPGAGQSAVPHPARVRRRAGARRDRPGHRDAGPVAPARPATPGQPRAAPGDLPGPRPGQVRSAAAWPTAGRRSSRTPPRLPAPPARPRPGLDPSGGPWRGFRAARPGLRPGGPHHATSLLTLSCGVRAAVLHRAGTVRARRRVTVPVGRRRHGLRRYGRGVRTGGRGRQPAHDPA